MKRFLKSGFFGGVLLTACLLGTNGLANAATQYLVTNDDVAPQPINSLSFYTVAPGELRDYERSCSVGRVCSHPRTDVARIVPFLIVVITTIFPHR
jgi:hypothetical protein